MSDAFLDEDYRARRGDRDYVKRNTEEDSTMKTEPGMHADDLYDDATRAMMERRDRAELSAELSSVVVADDPHPTVEAADHETAMERFGAECVASEVLEHEAASRADGTAFGEHVLHAEQYTLATVAFVLAAAMEASGITQAELACWLGVSEARVSQMLSADGNPTIKTLSRAFNALGHRILFRSEPLTATRAEPF